MSRRKQEAVTITDGIIVRPDAPLQTEHRYYTLLIKGFIVYLIVMGQLGCILSAFKISYNAGAVHLGVLAGALFSAFLYYTKVWENLGYFILFAAMFSSAVMLRRYISSGFFAVVNIISERAAYYFDTEVVQGYAESIGNREVTVTISMIYIGLVMSILLNAIVSRQMKYAVTMCIIFFALMVPFYLEMEPDLIYMVMLLSGCIITYIFRGAKHTPITTNDHKYIYMEKKRRLHYVYSAGSHMAVILTVLVVTFVTGGVLNTLISRDSYEFTRTTSSWKQGTLDAVGNIYRLGIWGLFNLYDSTGGLKSGTLGGVNSIQLDYETDLKITYVPYSADRIYLRSFTGDEYLYGENRWQRRLILHDDAVYPVPAAEETTSETAKLLKERYENDAEYSAKAKMEVENIAAIIDAYLPYYVDEESNPLILNMSYRNPQELEFYPLLDTGVLEEKLNKDKNDINDDINKADIEKDDNKSENNKTNKYDVNNSEKANNNKENNTDINVSETSKEIENNNVTESTEITEETEGYSSVPDENARVISDFCKQAGLTKYAVKNGENNIKTTEELIEKLAQYFQENIPYSYQPGITPRGEDFVNYFLAENKKGYCAHFASAGALIFRYLGYKARYIEGYAIDPTDLAEGGEIRTDLSTAEFYDGYSNIDQSRVITVDVTDASAHAWVEVEVDGNWLVADVTPYSLEDMPSRGWLQDLIGFLSGQAAGESSGGSDGAGITDGGDGGFGAMGDMIGRAFMTVFAGAAIIFIIFLLIRVLCGRVRYARADLNDRLVMDWQRYYRKKARRIKKQPLNYREQVDAIVATAGAVAAEQKAPTDTLSPEDADTLTELLEKAGFSNRQLTEEEYRQARELMK